jgi:hypothetical protein
MRRLLRTPHVSSRSLRHLPPTPSTSSQPMHVVSTLLYGGMPWLSARGHAMVEALIARRGFPGSAPRFALAVGLRSRFQLGRRLEGEGLPRLEVLAGWVRVLIWVIEWERTKRSLSRQSLEALRDPAVAYRTVRQVTGSGWTRVRELGSTWVLLSLLERCHYSAEASPRRRPSPLDSSCRAAAAGPGIRS